jgi:hypothetical protein
VADLGRWAKLMNKVFRYVLAAALFVPTAFLLWLNLTHLWLLYAPPRAYSGGLHLRIGSMRIYDPWSDVISLVTLTLVAACGVAILRNSTKSILAFGLGATALVMLWFSIL